MHLSLVTPAPTEYHKNVSRSLARGHVSSHLTARSCVLSAATAVVVCTQVWIGDVVDPAPPADSVPSTISMTWTTPCDVEV